MIRASGRFYINKISAILYCVIVGLACNNQATLFSIMDKSETGVAFTNTINYSDTLNILDYLYFYNGGGVAVGDINNDGLEDIYFSANLESNKLYLNKGNLKFEDITNTAGVQATGNWKTGVSMADVNGDGLLDIYVCEVGRYKNLHGHNELFINNGNLTFTEKSAEYGLNIEGFNTQSTFFDYDKDGDLDMFLVNHSVHSPESYSDASIRTQPNAESGDKLFRNDHSTFTEVTQAAGIYSSIIGYGLNVIAGDFNNDNWDDIYVSNDFHESDYYYINNRNGTFSEMNQQAFGHESRFSMGSDAGDVNNDGWLDIITLDMLPEDETILKSSASDDPLDIYTYKLNRGYHHQYSRNCLQLNVDRGKKFSDIALFAGIAATDWSWAPLIADFNNDGIKDLFVTNGIVKRPNDLDYLKFISAPAINNALQNGKSSDSIAIAQMPSGKVSNYIFEGTSQIKFINQTVSWGLNKPGLSNGAAFADLDNDGDQDIIVNNINEPAGIYRNNTSEALQNHYIDLQLKGKEGNVFSYGSKIVLICKGEKQLNYVTATRGFESSSTSMVHFGTGTNTLVDTIQVIWPDGKMQTLTNIKTNQKIVISENNADINKPIFLPGMNSEPASNLFVNITDSIKLDYKHSENSFVDFNMQQLIPHEVSTQGPKIAVADFNNDGLDDFFICGAKGQSGKLFQQDKRGIFTSVSEDIFKKDMECEDVNAVFFDADKDGDNDLYVVSGGNEKEGDDQALLDRLYINNGYGNFAKSKTLPAIYENKSVAAPADIDHDGDIDLFVGGRVIAGAYGENPGSYLLLNDGKGNFKRASETLSPGLRNIGMVTDAIWTDTDNDGWKDLVIVGEWMPVTVFRNTNGNLTNMTSRLNLQQTSGLWMTVSAADLNGDGWEDLLAGNLGENSKLDATKEFPLNLYVGDIDSNGATDQVLAIEKDSKYFPFAGKEDLEKQLPFIKKRFLAYKSMAGQTAEQVFANKLASANKLSATTLSSMVFINKRSAFAGSALPGSIQWSPVFAFMTGDFNNDKKIDILSGGNFYGVTPYEGRYDAGYGNVLLNIDSGWSTLPPWQSGLLLEGETRDIKKIKMANNQTYYLIARNNNTILVYKN